MAELEQRADTMVFAERRSPRLEERLRSDHQDFHGAVSMINFLLPFWHVNVTGEY